MAKLPIRQQARHAGQQFVAVAALQDPIPDFVQIVLRSQAVQQAGQALRRPVAELQGRLSAEELGTALSDAALNTPSDALFNTFSPDPSLPSVLGRFRHRRHSRFLLSLKLLSC